MPLYNQIYMNIVTTTINNLIQFCSYLFTCKPNIPEANYKVSATKKKKQQQNTYKKYKTRQFI
jgi:hypothetical protein